MVLRTYYKSSRSITNTLRKLQNFFGKYYCYHGNTIRKLVKNFQESGFIQDVTLSIRVRVGLSTETIANIRESVVQVPKMLILHRSPEFGISPTTTWQI